MCVYSVRTSYYVASKSPSREPKMAPIGAGEYVIAERTPFYKKSARLWITRSPQHDPHHQSDSSTTFPFKIVREPVQPPQAPYCSRRRCSTSPTAWYGFRELPVSSLSDGLQKTSRRSICARNCHIPRPI